MSDNAIAHPTYNLIGNMMLKKRKIIQISIATMHETEESNRESQVVALCNDGSVYMSLACGYDFYNEWLKLPEIPQKNTID